MRARARPRASMWIIGNVKLAVFPVPVWAMPKTSLPFSAAGIAPAWIGVGVSYPASVMAFKIFGFSSKSANVVMCIRLLRTLLGPRL